MLGLESTIDSPRWGTRFRHSKGGKGGGGGGGGSKGGGGGGGSKGGGGGGGGSKGGGGGGSSSGGGGGGGGSKSGGGSSGGGSKSSGPAKAVQAAVSYTKQGAPIASGGPSSSKASSKGKTASPTQQKAQDLLARFGAKVSAKEATKAQKQGVSLADLTKAANKADVKIRPGAKAVYNPATGTATQSPASTPGPFDQGVDDTGFIEDIPLEEGEMTAAEYAAIIGNLNGAIESNKAQIYADAQKFESLQATERTRIETKGKLDLQPIINAGLKEVQEIAGQYAVKEEQTRQAGQKDIARIGTRSNILQGLVGAFNF
jgi:hypothetical protein